MSINIQNGGIALILMIIGPIIVLIGLIGGGIEIKEVKIPPIINKAQKIAVSSFGIALLLLGIYFNWVANTTPAPPSPPTSTATPVLHPSPPIATTMSEPNSSSPTPTITPVATPVAVSNTTPAVECPDANTVANLMNFPQGQSKVQPNGEPCGFHWGDVNNVYTTQAHCPDGYGPVSVQLTPATPGKIVFLDCNGTDSLQGMYGAQIRFQNWNPTDICAIARDYKKQYPQTIVDAPARCGVQ